MQIYADVLGKEICVADSRQACALGSAVYAAVAAGIYRTVPEASARMAKPATTVYRPDAGRQEVYNGLYREYRLLHDYFGRGENAVMERLAHLSQGIEK